MTLPYLFREYGSEGPYVLCSFTEAYMRQNSGNSNTTNLMINPIRW